MSNSYPTLIPLLGRIFLEIRAAKKLKNGQILADIAHNAPSGIQNGLDEQEVLARMRLTAERHGAEKYFDMLIHDVRSPKTAMRRVGSLKLNDAFDPDEAGG